MFGGARVYNPLDIIYDQVYVENHKDYNLIWIFNYMR